MVQNWDANVLNTNDEGRGTGIAFAGLVRSEQCWVVRGHNDTNDKGAETVEDGQTPDESSSGFGNVASWSNSFTSSDSNQLGRCDEGETSSDKGVPVAKKAASAAGGLVFDESSRGLPVVESKHAVRFGSTAKENDDTKNDEAHDGDELDTGEPKFGLTEEADGDNVEEKNNHQNDSDPYCNIDTGTPVVNDDTSGSGFGTNENGICVPVIPTSGKTKTWVNKAINEVRNSNTAHRQIRDHLGKAVHHDPDKHHHGDVCHE